MTSTSEMNNKNDITQHEIFALQSQHNLADAHTHQNQSVSQRDIIGMLPDIWYRAKQKTQRECELEFIEAFYSLHNQETALKRKNSIYLVYAASVAMHITATLLKKRKSKVALVEPCFDNLHDLLKHMEIPLKPVPESCIHSYDTAYEMLDLYASDSDAVFFVDPNNPTGFSMFHESSNTFTEVIRYCKDNNKVLIVDFCFASFLIAGGYGRPDVYKLLEESGVSYIAMEDTGKTWPLQDAKCASLMCSRDIDEELYPIYTSVLLNVSPFILSLVTEYVKDSDRDDFFSVRDILNRNREALVSTIESLDIELCPSLINTSVAWLKVGESLPRSNGLQRLLEKDQVYVLPGTFFYWCNPSFGDDYVRVALARDPSDFENAMKTMAVSLNVGS